MESSLGENDNVASLACRLQGVGIGEGLKSVRTGRRREVCLMRAGDYLEAASSVGRRGELDGHIDEVANDLPGMAVIRNGEIVVSLSVDSASVEIEAFCEGLLDEEDRFVVESVSLSTETVDNGMEFGMTEERAKNISAIGRGPLHEGAAVFASRDAP